MRRVVVALTCLVLVAGGCASPRSNLGAGSTACFKVIPQARQVVGKKAGRLQGVRELKADRLATRLPQLAKYGKRDLCLVAFGGDFKPGDIPNAMPPGPGRFAVVVVDIRTGKVVATFVTQKLPIRFRHLA